MKTGVERTRGNVIVFIDADGAHDASDVPAVIAPIVCDGASFVIGSRCLPQSQVAVSPFVRRLGNRFASIAITGIISLLLPVASLFRCPPRHIRITDCTSGFRAMRRDAWHGLELVSKGFQIETEMIYEAARNGLAIAEAPISCDWNAQFSHLSIFSDGATTAMLLAWKLLREIPGRRRPSLDSTPRSEPTALFSRHAPQETD
jgi:glycosyltransferase involved in cell wall biosynthesis